MKYNFDKLTDRRGVNSLKWDCAVGELPMWVADMDFENAPCIQKAVEERAKKGIFGYTVVGEEWYNSIINWWSRRHNWHIQRDWLIFCTGIVPAITSMVKRLSEVGDDVVILTPVYDIFFHSVENTGRHVAESPLLYDGQYSIDWADLEQKLSRPTASLMILCNPHNPVGKLWSAEELKRIGDLCIKHHVTVISDEIHCDICSPESSYVPFASLGEKYAQNCAVCISATKAFNIAGLQCAAVAVPNEALRAKVERGLNSDEVAEPNCFAEPRFRGKLFQGKACKAPSGARQLQLSFMGGLLRRHRRRRETLRPFKGGCGALDNRGRTVPRQRKKFCAYKHGLPPRAPCGRARKIGEGIKNFQKLNFFLFQPPPALRAGGGTFVKFFVTVLTNAA